MVKYILLKSRVYYIIYSQAQFKENGSVLVLREFDSFFDKWCNRQRGIGESDDQLIQVRYLMSTQEIDVIGSIPVSKTVSIGSSPVFPAKPYSSTGQSAGLRIWRLRVRISLGLPRSLAETGRRGGLKHHCISLRVGSIPAGSTNALMMESWYTYQSQKLSSASSNLAGGTSLKRQKKM